MARDCEGPLAAARPRGVPARRTARASAGYDDVGRQRYADDRLGLSLAVNIRDDDLMTCAALAPLHPPTEKTPCGSRVARARRAVHAPHGRGCAVRIPSAREPQRELGRVASPGSSGSHTVRAPRTYRENRGARRALTSPRSSSSLCTIADHPPALDCFDPQATSFCKGMDPLSQRRPSPPGRRIRAPRPAPSSTARNQAGPAASVCACSFPTRHSIARRTVIVVTNAVTLLALTFTTDSGANIKGTCESTGKQSLVYFGHSAATDFLIIIQLSMDFMRVHRASRLEQVESDLAQTRKLGMLMMPCLRILPMHSILITGRRDRRWHAVAVHVADLRNGYRESQVRAQPAAGRWCAVITQGAPRVGQLRRSGHASRTGADSIVDYASWLAPYPRQHASPRRFHEPLVPGGSLVPNCQGDWADRDPRRFNSNGAIERLGAAGIDETHVADLTTSGVRRITSSEVVDLAHQVTERHRRLLEPNGDVPPAELGMQYLRRILVGPSLETSPTPNFHDRR